MTGRAEKHASSEFAAAFRRFRRILYLNNRVLEKIAEMERVLGGEYIFDRTFLNQSVAELNEGVREVIYTLNALAGDRYTALYSRFSTISDHLTDLLTGGPGPLGHLLVLDLQQAHRDLDHLIGAKNANLGEIRKNKTASTPDGFAVTTASYTRFMEANNLYTNIASIISADMPAPEQAAHIAQLFKKAQLPDEIDKSIRHHVGLLEKKTGQSLRFAVRSSAVGEDGDRSFAGQFLSLLDIAAVDVPDACLQVMASRFSAHILQYLGKTTGVEQYPVAVGVQPMVDAQAAGVIYTRDPNHPENEAMSISAVSGRANLLVDGKSESDHYLLSRQFPFALLSSRIKGRPAKQQLTEKDQTTGRTTKGLQRGSAILHTGDLGRLGESAMLLEKYFEGPRDIEWAMTRDGQLVILQCRPLRLAHRTPPPADEILRELRQAPVVMAGRGHVVQMGMAAGRVVIVSAETRPHDFPVNSIAVCRYATPQISEIVRRAAAVITDVGSPTGHLATIAREFRTPALFGTDIATTVLTEGMEITVDVEEKKIYGAILPGLLSAQPGNEDLTADYPEMRTLRRLLRLVAPLTLQNPATPEFRGKNCRTFHDILRFCHEKAMDSIIALHSSEKITLRHDRGDILSLPIPIRLRVIDLDDGIDKTAKEDLQPDDIHSRPFNALLRGMLNQEAWNREPVPFGFKDLMTSITRPLSTFSRNHQYSGDNLAIIAANYCNLSLRLGYHFNVIDAYLDEDPDDNYIYFRFVGGMAEKEKRGRRVELIARILGSLHFRTERQGDLLIGKAKMLAAEHMENILVCLGELVAFTRQLDVRLVDNATVENLFAQFLSRTIDGWDEITGD